MGYDAKLQNAFRSWIYQSIYQSINQYQKPWLSVSVSSSSKRLNRRHCVQLKTTNDVITRVGVAASATVLLMTKLASCFLFRRRSASNELRNPRQHWPLHFRCACTSLSARKTSHLKNT